MLASLQSKTVIGLLTLLAVACVMACFGKLTPQLVDVIKWVGASYMAVRGIANYTENKSA